MSIIRGYKVFNPDWTCRGFKYEVGKTYELDGELEICKNGFHFCKNMIDCYDYYKFYSYNKVAEIEAIGEVITKYNKSATDKIKIVREISWHEVLDTVNTGIDNVGKGNSGTCNSGDFNSGDFNSGKYNSGDFNIVDYSNGFFNTASQPVYMFNKITDLTHAEIKQLSGIRCLYNHLYHFVNAVTLEEMFAEKWSEFTEEEKQAIRELPNFDSDIFYEITGVKL